jgi:hypothetical protein
MFILCHARITLGPRRETYCMRRDGHLGDHDIKPHPEDHLTEPLKAEKAESDAPASE